MSVLHEKLVLEFKQPFRKIYDIYATKYYFLSVSGDKIALLQQRPNEII